MELDMKMFDCEYEGQTPTCKNCNLIRYLNKTYVCIKFNSKTKKNDICKYWESKTSDFKKV